MQKKSPISDRRQKYLMAAQPSISKIPSWWWL